MAHFLLSAGTNIPGRSGTQACPGIKPQNSKKPLKKICVGKTARNSTTFGKNQTKNRIRKTGQKPNGSALLPKKTRNPI
jgi:hypothetical protein